MMDPRKDAEDAAVRARESRAEALALGETDPDRASVLLECAKSWESYAHATLADLEARPGKRPAR